MTSCLCFVCYNTVSFDTNEEIRDKYREMIGMELSLDAHLCYICCHMLNKFWTFKSICSKRSLEYLNYRKWGQGLVLFREKALLYLQESDTDHLVLCSEELCNEYKNINRNTRYFTIKEDTDQLDIHDYTGSNVDKKFNQINYECFTNDTQNSTNYLYDFENTKTVVSSVSLSYLSNNDEVAVNDTKNEESSKNYTDLLENLAAGVSSVHSDSYLSNNDKSNSTNDDDDTKNDFNIEEYSYLLNNDRSCSNNDDNDTQNEPNIDGYSYLSNNDRSNSINDTQNDRNIEESTENNTDLLDNDNAFITQLETREVNTNDGVNENNDSNKRKKKSKKKKEFEKILLTLEKQKAQLERNRREKKYIEAEFKCYNCALGFLFKDTYQTHMMRHEESNGEYLCGTCSLRFASPGVLRAHTALHALRYRCRRCEAILPPRARSDHARECFLKPAEVLACHLCGRVFKKSSGLQQHLKRFHQKNTSRSYCSVCGKSCSSLQAVRTHMITHVHRKFTCEQCPATFSSPYTLTQHKKKHGDQRPLHFCQTCSTSFSSRKGLLAHYRNSTAHQNTMFECPICNRTCPTQRSLTSHLETVHSVTRPYQCASCPSRFATQRSLRKHAAKHEVGGTSKAVCQLCGRCFTSNSKLNRHLREVCEKEKLEEQLSAYYE